MLQDRRREAAHLLRRAGFGASTPDELSQVTGQTHRQAVARLLDFNPAATALQYDLQDRLLAAGVAEENWGQWELQLAWLEVMLQTSYPLQEKLALFWHGHFTSSINKVGNGRWMLEQNLYFRQHALGNFARMVRAISRDPAMLIWLDGVDNSRENPNENYARELMELFTLGPGHYTEQDIREAARAFTGWRYQDGEGEEPYQPRIAFDPELYDNGLKTFMGVRGQLDGDAIISIILRQRQAAYFVAGRLWEYLVYPDPPLEVIRPLGDLFFNSGYEIRPLVEAILLHPDFLAERAYRALVKSPVELVVGGLRALGVRRVEDDPLYSMGQSLFAPPNVKGWPGGRRWINSATYLARANYFANLLSPDSEQPGRLPVFNRYANRPLPTAFQELAGLLVDGQAHGLAEIEKFARTPQSREDDDDQSRAQAADASLRGAVHLLMSCPEYQLN